MNGSSPGMKAEDRQYWLRRPHRRLRLRHREAQPVLALSRPALDRSRPLRQPDLGGAVEALKSHCYAGGGLPVALTLNVAAVPATFARLVGWLVIAGGRLIATERIARQKRRMVSNHTPTKSANVSLVKT